MITIFSIPKPFDGHVGLIQANAIKSWQMSNPKARIVIYGNELGTEEICEKLNLEHVPQLQLNEFGTPILSFVFEHVKTVFNPEFLLYVNTDIMLMEDFTTTIEHVQKRFGNRKFLVAGRRIDLDINQEIDVYDAGWRSSLSEKIQNFGILHGYSGIDYFLFPENVEIKLKGFAVGRPGWDNWFVSQCINQKIPVIDATDFVQVIHQNHAPAYTHRMQESQDNIKLVGKFSNLANLMSADYLLNNDGVVEPGLKRSLIRYFYTNKLMSSLIKVKRLVVYQYNKLFA